MDEVRIPPAGDPFTAKPAPRPSEATDETPHACMGGWVFLGYEGEDGQGRDEAVPCRRCLRTSSDEDL